MKIAQFLRLVLTGTFCFSLGVPAIGAEKVRNEYSFSLESISRLALSSNFEIQLAQYDDWISKTGQDSAESIFDTILMADVKYQDDQSKRTSVNLGTKSTENDYNIGILKKLPTGTTVAVDMANNRTWTDASVASSALTHDSSLGLTITQPIGKNFFGLKDRGNISITKLNIDNVRASSLDRIEEHLANVQKQYWDLVYYKELAGIENDMFQQARRLYDLHQEKLNDGLIEKAELIATQANYQYREDQLALALNRVHMISNAIALSLNIEQENIEIHPEETLQIATGEEQFIDAIKAAIVNRRDYQQRLNTVEAKKLKLTMDKNNTWPEINLTASLERNGLGDHFRSAVTNISAEDNPNYSVGLAVTFPLENREARSALKATELEKTKAILDLKYTERKISTEISDQTRDCRVYRDVAVSSEKIAQLQSQKLAEEEKRFNRGRSNTDTLIRYQEDVLRARSLSAEAKHRYQKSRIDLELKKGTLLTRYWNGT